MRFKKFIVENYIRQHLIDRGVDISDRRLFPIFIDSESDVAYFPLYNLSGQMVGYQRYNPKGKKDIVKADMSDIDNFKYYTYIGVEGDKHNRKKIGVYGLHTLDDRPFVFMVEGIFDAVKLIKLGLPTIAVLGNDPKQLTSFLFILQKKIYAILDNDVNLAGNKLANLASRSFKVPSPFKDLGDMSLSEVRSFISALNITGVDI